MNQNNVPLDWRENRKINLFAYFLADQYGRVGDETKNHNLLRLLASKNFVTWVYGYVGKNKRTGLPSCVVATIRKKCPSSVYIWFIKKVFWISKVNMYFLQNSYFYFGTHLFDFRCFDNWGESISSQMLSTIAVKCLQCDNLLSSWHNLSFSTMSIKPLYGLDLINCKYQFTVFKNFSHLYSYQVCNLSVDHNYRLGKVHFHDHGYQPSDFQ